MLETAIAPAPTTTEGDDGVWIEALPARIYHTPQYGEVPVTVDKLERMITNFKANVRGQDIATDFEHGLDSAKGKQASGWYKDFDIRPSSDDPTQMSLYAKVQLTDEAKQDVQAGKWKYWSLEWDDEYQVDTGGIVPDVVIGGGLTNRPVAKRTMPINFSEELWNELDDDTRKQFAVWNTAYVNSLPDSAFLYIDSNGRHLPYKDKSGKIDLPHLRAAASRANQVSGIPAATVTRIRAKIQRLLGGSSKAASESSDVQAAYDLLNGQGFEVYPVQVLSENAAWAHSDPGIVAPLYGAVEQPDPGFGRLVPRVVGNPADDAAVGGGWRWEPLPAGKPTPPGDTIDADQHREPSGKDMSEFAEGPASTTATPDLMKAISPSGETSVNEPASSDAGYLQDALEALMAFVSGETGEQDEIEKAQVMIATIKNILSDEWNEMNMATQAQAQVQASEFAKQVKEFAERNNIKIAKGGKTVEFTEENVTELRTLLAIPDDADSDKFMESARSAFSELKTFKDTVGQTTQEKQFSEQFPAVWAEHQKLLDTNRAAGARAFAESVQRLTTPKGEGDSITFEPTRTGLSALALDTIAETHKKFSEGTATLEDFETTVKAVTNGGIVEFGEVGSSAKKDLPAIDTSTAQGIQGTRKVFADKVAEVQKQYSDKNDGKEMDFSEAVAKTSELYPDLAAAYRATAA